MKLRFVEKDHAYFLDGKSCMSVTWIAKIPDNKRKLEDWQKRQTMIGMAIDLAEGGNMADRVAAHIDDKDILNAICEEAIEKAKANDAARHGSAVHRLTDRIDMGETLVQTQMARDVEALWNGLWASAGLRVLPEYIERIVVYPDRRICGKLDRIGLTEDGRLVIVDTKTGKWELDFPHSAGVQFSLYAHAPLLAGKLDSKGETEEFEPMPDVDKNVAYMVHMPINGKAQVVEVDIAQAWKSGAAAARACLKWRDVPKRVLVRPIASFDPKPPPTLDEGAELTNFEIDRLRKDFKNCSTKAAVDVWLKESIEAGKSFHLTAPHGIPSERRAAIIRAAIAWSGFDDDVVRAALGLLLSYEVQTSVPTGAAFGSLTIEEARRFALLADGITLTFRDDGTPIVAVA